MARGAKPATAKVTAKRPVAAKRTATAKAKATSKRPGTAKRPAASKSRAAPGAAAIRALEQRLAEAVEQQTATNEILRVMAASSNDVQPVLEAVAQRAAHLCDAPYARIFLADGDVLRNAADYSLVREPRIPVQPVALRRTSITGRAVIDGDIVHLADVVPLLDKEFPDSRDNAQLIGVRAALAMPLLREGGAYGAIFLWKREPGLFPPDQVALVQTFARQAAIAIEGSRLFGELQTRNRDISEALEQQTATSDILRVISQSQTDVQPVFDTIAQRAGKLCDAEVAVVSRFDGTVIELAAIHGVVPEAVTIVRRLYPMQLSAQTVTARVIRSSSVVHIPDVLAEEGYAIKDFARAARYRSGLGVPIVRNGKVIGSIFVGRSAPGLFSESQIELLKTFSEQAVIAIENVRLFTELGNRNRDLSVALEQQTATAEILRAISASPTDVQPVFDTIATSAARLCEAEFCHVFRFDGTLIHFAAADGLSPEGLAAIRNAYPMAPGRGSAAARSIASGTVEHIPDVAADPDYAHGTFAKIMAFRSIVAVPMLRDGVPIGAIAVARSQTGIFPTQQIELLRTFADQAVIAIENVRLFNELDARNRDLSESLEQQEATGEILSAIASSPTDIQPVLETVVRAAARFCGAPDVLLMRADNGVLRGAAAVGPFADILRSRSGSINAVELPLTRDSVSGRAAVEHRTIHIHDLAAESEDEYPVGRELQRLYGHRTLVSVPLLREGVTVGVIVLFRTEVKPFSDRQLELVRIFADQAVIAIENVRLFTELGNRNRDLTEALEQQNATGEVLNVISRSPTDVRPVFDTIAQSALALCRASAATMLTYDGTLIHLASAANVKAEANDAIRKLFPRPPSNDTAGTRAIMTRRVVVIPDVLEDRDYSIGSASHFTGFRGVMAVPLIRDDVPIGAIAVGRPEPGPFSEKQIALLQTFADQAVIAIENVRLFTELEARNKDLTQSLEQQTATSEILRVISQSPTDVSPVFNTIAQSAMQLCAANTGLLTTFDGELVHVAAIANATPEGSASVRRAFPRKPSNDNASARAVYLNSVVVIPDIMKDAEYTVHANALAGGFRSILSVPLTRDAAPIGAITVGRPDPGPFSEREIALLKTFADQAVIAIENVRLFTELEARNKDLTQSLEQQTATSEILRAISQSQTDVRPVFDTIAQRAGKLCDAEVAVVSRFDDSVIELAAIHGVVPDAVKIIRDVYPLKIDSHTVSARVIRSGAVVHYADVLADPSYATKEFARAARYRGALGVPIIRDAKIIGSIFVGRSSPGLFSESQIELLKTFSEQAVIAIENVRLFKELESRTTQLTRSVGELKALGEVGQAVSSTLDLETVLRTIVARATELSGMDGGSIYEYDEAAEVFHLHTAHRLPAEVVDALRASPIPKGEGALGQLAVTGDVVQIRDISDEAVYKSRVRKMLLRSGYRSLLAVPLLREDHLLGGLVVNRATPGGFTPEVIDLLKTFATQSALAIQNARLFHEIGDKSRQLEVASRHKSEFLANMSHELRTPLNAIIGFSEVLADRMFGEINDKQAEYLADILESGRHLLALINDILDLSKIEAGRMELDLDDFNLPAAIDNTVTLIRERAHRRGITVERAIGERVGVIRADERKVKQVLLNLLSNALKFTPEGGGISVRSDVRDGIVEISVTDTGIGIAPEDQATVFEEFRQVGTRAKKVEGTGLGLAISRKFIELHGGRIWVTSTVGVGSTFAFTLPLTAAS